MTNPGLVSCYRIHLSPYSTNRLSAALSGQSDSKLLSQFTYSSQAIPSWACIVLHTNPPYAKYNHECLIALIYHYKFSPVVSSGLGVEAIPLDLCLLCLPNSELAILPEGAVVHHLADQANAKVIELTQ